MTADEDLEIAISRSSYQRLIGVTCTLYLESPENSWSQSLIVDIGGLDNAPTIVVDNPGVLDNDDLITAEFRCASPYDIDDNPEDDTAQAYYKSAKSEIIENSQLIYGTITVIIVLGIAYLAGLLTTNRQRKPRPEKVRANSSAPDTIEETEEVEDSAEEDIDDFSLEIAEDYSTDEIIEIIEHDEPEPAETEEPDDSSASGRLASLRDEIMTDEKPVDTRPLSDRMADFFKD